MRGLSWGVGKGRLLDKEAIAGGGVGLAENSAKGRKQARRRLLGAARSGYNAPD